MRVFVTGAGGFVGAPLVRRMLARGWEVAVLARSASSLRRLADIRPQLTLFEGRLSDLAELRPRLAAWGPEALVHLAWYAEPGKYLNASENISALTESLAWLEAFLALGCRQIVAAGSCAEYDTDAGYLLESGPTRPTTLYAAAKLALMLTGQQLAAAAQARFAWARLFYLYGPSEDERRMIPALIQSLRRAEPFPATAGEQVRDYLHVDDVARALQVLVEKRADGIFNVASGAPVQVRRIMEMVGDILGRRELIRFGASPYRDWEPMFVCGDNRRLRAFDWQPAYPLEAGLRDVIAWWGRCHP